MALALLAAAALPAAGAVIYSVDDGTADFTSGLTPSGGSVVFANRFTTVPGGELIQSISVSYGLRGAPGVTKAGVPVRVLLFRDRDGSATPSHPVLLRSAATEVTKPGTDTFIEVPITPAAVSGEFFVGVLASGLPFDGPYPFSFDRTLRRGRSFGAFFSDRITESRLSVMYYDANRTTSSTGNINTNAFVRAADGNFMIRATGVPLPEPAAPAALALAACLALRRRGRRVSARHGNRK